MDRVGGVEFHGDETEELLDHFRARLLEEINIDEVADLDMD